jgi:hypothetical protein
MVALRQGGAGQDADPQATLISKLTGIGRAHVQLGWELMFALLLELGAAFLPYLAAPELSAHAHGARRGRAQKEETAHRMDVGKAAAGTEAAAAGWEESRWVENAKKKGLLRE